MIECVNMAGVIDAVVEIAMADKPVDSNRVDWDYVDRQTVRSALIISLAIDRHALALPLVKATPQKANQAPRKRFTTGKAPEKARSDAYGHARPPSGPHCPRAAKDLPRATTATRKTFDPEAKGQAAQSEKSQA